MNQFYLTLPSNSLDFATNTTGEYRITLPHTIDLQGSWEVGLASIQYPHTWYTIKKESFVMYLKLLPEPIVFDVEDGNYSTIADLIVILNRAVKFGLEKWSGQSDDGSGSDLPLTFEYNEITKRIEMKVASDYIECIYLGRHLQYMLGFGEGLTKFTNNHNIGKYPPDLTGGFNSLFVYCSLIEPQIVGNIMAPLLRVIAVKGSFSDTIVKEFTNIHYMNVLSKQFHSVEVSIKGDDNLPITFMFGKTLLKLHFRKKRYF